MPYATPAEWIARTAAFNSDLRGPTADEAQLIAAALEAGAGIVGRLWREYFSGQSERLPIQFEGCYRGAEDHGFGAIISANIARRDAYLARVQGGDLAPVAARVRGEGQRVAA